MANVVLRFRHINADDLDDLPRLLEPGSFVSTSAPAPAPFEDVIVDDAISDAAAVAVEAMESKGYVLVATDPTTALARGETPDSLTWAVETAQEINSHDLTAEITNPRGFYLPPTQPKLYVYDNTTTTVFEYDLTAPLDLSVAPVYTGNSIVTISGTGFILSDDGTVAYLLLFAGGVREFALSTPFDLSTASAGSTTNIAGITATVGFSVYNGGTDVLFTQSTPNGVISHWRMTAPWDWSTLVDTGNTFSTGLTWGSGGTACVRADWRAAVAIDPGGQLFIEYVMDTPGDISTMRQVATAPAAIVNSNDAAVSPDGTRLYSMSQFGDDVIYEYSMGLRANGIAMDMAVDDNRSVVFSVGGVPQARIIFDDDDGSTGAIRVEGIQQAAGGGSNVRIFGADGSPASGGSGASMSLKAGSGVDPAGATGGTGSVGSGDATGTSSAGTMFVSGGNSVDGNAARVWLGPGTASGTGTDGTIVHDGVDEFVGKAAPAVSDPGEARSYLDSTTNTMRRSMDGAPYFDVAGVPIGAKEVWRESDLGVESGGVITLTETVYVFRAAITTAHDIDLNGLDVMFIGVQGSAVTRLTYTGASISGLFQDNSGGSISLVGMQVVLTGDGGMLFDIANATTAVRVRNCLLAWTNDNGSIGLIINSNQFLVRDTTISGFRFGLVAENLVALSARILNVQPAANFSDPAVFRFNGTGVAQFEGIAGIFVAPGIFMFDIDPRTGAPIVLKDMADLTGLFNAFATDLSGAITTIADAAVSGSILSVADNGSGSARFTASAAHGMFDGQKVTHTAFSEGTYNGVDLVIDVITATTYDIVAIADAGTDTGSFASDSVTMTAAAHGLTNGEGVLIDNTINYDGGLTVYNATLNTFQVDGVFDPGETSGGTFDNGSLTQASPKVFLDNVAKETDSANIGSIVVVANTVATTINTINIWEDLDLGGLAVEGSSNTFWRLIDSDTGELRYDGLEDFVGELVASVSTTSSSGTQRFQLRAVINGAPAVDGVLVSVDLSSSPMVPVPVVVPIALSPGDTVRLQVRNTSGTSDVLAQDVSLSVK